MKLVTNKFKSGGLHEKHVVATWNLGNHLSICLQTQGKEEKNRCLGGRSRWMVLFTKEYFPISVLCLLLLIFRSGSTLLR